MSSLVEQQPDAWQQNAIFTQLLQAPAAKEALTTLEKHIKPVFNSHAFYSLETGMLTVKLQTLTSLLINANILPHLTSHDFKLGLHLAIAPTLSQSASPSKDQPLHFDTFINAVAFCAYYYPPQTDPLQTPNPRLPECPIGLEVALATACQRLVASSHSPRSIVANLHSPATTHAFATPRTTFPEASPTESNASDFSASPGTEHWFTPAQSALRTKLFPAGESNGADERDQHSDSEATLRDVVSFPPTRNDSISESETKPEAYGSNFVETTDICATPRLSEKKQDLPSLTPSCADTEKSWHPSRSEDSRLEKVEAFSPPTTRSDESEEVVPQEQVEVFPQLEASSDGQSISEGTPATPAVALVASPLVQPALASAPGGEKKDPTGTPQVAEHDSPESARTSLSLAPSTALSQLPSLEESFESPELIVDPGTPYNPSSVEPMSSRKLSFSDSDEASDASSCYDNGSDCDDTMTRIENAFEDSHAVDDCEEEDASSDLLSPYPQLPSSVHEDAVLTQSAMEGGTGSEINLVNTGLQSSSEGDKESGMETAQSFQDSYSFASEWDSAHSDLAPTPDMLNEIDENKQTHEAKITLGLPAGAFSEPGSAALRTPVALAMASRFPDTDMEDVDEEDHTLLFENGNESDGSELSMGTRETMSKMVEDYLSLHGSASPQCDLVDFSYAKDQVLITPDRKSHVAFRKEIATDRNTIVEDGPCFSDKTDTTQSRIERSVEHSIRDLGNGGDGDKLRFKVEMDGVEHDATDDALSTPLYSQNGSFSSEITPDGLSLIKKQLVLPSPFVFTDSTVGSSLSSGSNAEMKEKVKPAEETEKGAQGIVTVAVKKEHAEGEESIECDGIVGMREVEMMRVMRETLETCRVLREEIARREQIPHHSPQLQQTRRGCGGWIEVGFFGLLVVFVTLVLVERRIQRGLFLDVLV